MVIASASVLLFPAWVPRHGPSSSPLFYSPFACKFLRTPASPLHHPRSNHESLHGQCTC
jgi:hypothetical protein